MDLRGARDLLDHQDGVVARWQLLEAGATDADIRRWHRRRELAPMHPGVYVSHTGPPTWVNRAWAAVLVCWPAALTHESVVHAAGDVIHVAVDRSRKPERRDGVRVHRLADFENRVRWNLGPPKVRLEDAVLSLCSLAVTRSDALAVASDACRRRRTTPERLLTELARRPRLHHRAWLADVLRETAEGIQSPLESSYVRRVERAHGLPRGERQLRQVTSRGVVYRDVSYEAYRVLVELDGRIGHELSRDRWRDMDRDLEAAAADHLTLRVGWRHCEDRPCDTARRIGTVLSGRGWPGTPRRCGTGCSVDVRIAIT